MLIAVFSFHFLQFITTPSKSGNAENGAKDQDGFVIPNSVGVSLSIGHIVHENLIRKRYANINNSKTTTTRRKKYGQLCVAGLFRI